MIKILASPPLFGIMYLDQQNNNLSTHHQNELTNQPPAWVAFFRHQVAAVLATSADFGIYRILYDYFETPPHIATIFSSLIGATISYTLGRYWAFKATNSRHTLQMVKYGIVSLGSATLNSLGIFILFDLFGFHEMWSKVIVAICIGIPYNFSLHKRWVFK